MPRPRFDARKIRKSLRPTLSMREMARRLEITPAYLSELERGIRGRPQWRPEIRDRFAQVVAGWRAEPNPRVRKTRVAKPRAPVTAEAAVVPHPHGEIVGIG